MALAPLGSQIFQSIQRGETTWPQIVKQHGRKNALGVLSMLTHARSTERSRELEGVIKAGFQELKKHNLGHVRKKMFTLVQKTDGEVKKVVTARAKGKAPEESHPPLRTVPVTDPKVAKKLKKISVVWEKKAQVREAARRSIPGLAEDKKLEDTSLDSVNLTSCLSDWMPKKPNRKKKAVYATLDESGKVHAIALATMSKKKKKLDFIATNPDDLPLLGTEKAVRGAGSALVRHIAQDAKKMGGKKSLRLDAVSSAIPFYKKLGFKAGSRTHSLRKMSMKKHDLETLVKSKAPTHTMEDKDPSVTDIH